MRRLGPITALLVAGLAAAGLARGEPVQEGNLRLAFNGGFEPRSLPRDRLAPVTVSLSGSVRTTDGSTPPPLRQITFAVNRHGRLSSEGLPTCRDSQLEGTSTALALSRCRDALVGHGSFGANVSLPNLRVPVAGKILAFNSRSKGRPTILIHIYGSRPVQVTFVLKFTISHRRGEFGTILSTRIPKIASDLGYVTDIDLTFGRHYARAGQPQSFLSARCAAPVGFSGVHFTFARGTFAFASGQRLTTTLASNCHVR